MPPMGLDLLEVWAVDGLGIFELWENISNFAGFGAGKSY